MRPHHFLHSPRFGREMLGLNHSIKAISVLFFIYMLGWGMVDPLIPVYVNGLFGTYTAVGIVMSALQFFSLFWSLLIGPLLDHVRKKSLISVVLFLYLPLSPILLSLTTLAQFVAFRAYHAVIATTLWATSEAYVREHSPRHKEAQAIGLYDFSVGLAQVCGGLLGAALVLSFGYSIIYAVMVFAFLALLISFFIPDHGKQRMLDCFSCIGATQIKKEFADLRQNHTFRKLLMYIFPFFVGVSLMPMTVPLFVRYVGGSLSTVLIASALFYFPVLFESYFAATREKRRTMTLGLVSAALLFWALFLSESAPLTFVLVLLIGIAFAAVSPIISGRLTELMPKKEVGEMSAVVYSTKSFAAAAGPLIAGLIADSFGINYVFLIGFVLFMGLLVFRKAAFEK